MFGRLTAIALTGSACALALVVLLTVTSPSPTSPPPAEAAFHIAEIDEIMTSYGGDPNVQFVEIEMLATGQQFVTGSVLGAWDASGTYLGTLYTVGNDDHLASGANRPWLMATSAFEMETGLAPDFEMPGGLPTGGGMVCWGIPSMASVPGNYVDCVAYGTYSGPGNIHIGSSGQFPAPDDADGHSLQRVSHTNQSASDFVCADPATPENNVPTSVNMTATTACSAQTPTPTPTPTPPPGGDADGDTVPDGSDNCPYWPNPSQTLPPWSVPPDDGDCDHYSDTDEGTIGTDPQDACADTMTANDERGAAFGEPESPWPVDFDDNRVVNITDVGKVLPPTFGGNVPPVSPRFDIVPNGTINISDVGKVLPPFFGKSCT